MTAKSKRSKIKSRSAPVPDKDGMIVIVFKDTLLTRQKLLDLAAKQGHGVMGEVVRRAVRQYLGKEDKAA